MFSGKGNTSPALFLPKYDAQFQSVGATSLQEIMTEMVNLTDKLRLSDCTMPEFTLQAAIAAVFPAEYRTTGYQALQDVIADIWII